MNPTSRCRSAMCDRHIVSDAGSEGTILYLPEPDSVLHSSWIKSYSSGAIESHLTYDHVCDLTPNIDASVTMQHTSRVFKLISLLTATSASVSSTCQNILCHTSPR